jgi:hypothetical protein
MAVNHNSCVRPNITTSGIINKNKTKEQKGKMKILLIGDSHIKGLSSELNHSLGGMHEAL